MKRFWAVIIAVVSLSGCLPKQPLGKMCYIDSIPAEAQVYILGKPAGLTPIEFELPPGATVSVKKDGYAEEQLTREQLEAGYAMLFLKQLYNIDLNYIPKGSEVWEDGKLLGTTPFTIKKTAGVYTLVVRHEYHKDFVDEFKVTGQTIRIKLLKPTVKYFPQTICVLGSDPKGVNVEHYSVDDFKLTGPATDFGTTPINQSNLELSKLSPQHLFVYRLKGFAPQVITATGSFIANIKMEPEISCVDPSSDWFSKLPFKTGEIASPSKSYTFWTEKRDDKFAVISKKEVGEVDILDMKTDYTNVSGAAWADDRFFVVRAKKPSGWVYYIIYDAVTRKRFRVSNAGFWHEVDIAGDIEWGQRVPVNPTQVEEFADIKITVSKNFSVASLRLFDGYNLEFTVMSDNNFDKPKLARVRAENAH